MHGIGFWLLLVFDAGMLCSAGVELALMAAVNVSCAMGRDSDFRIPFIARVQQAHQLLYHHALNS
jgi:hypothetical protein